MVKMIAECGPADRSTVMVTSFGFRSTFERSSPGVVGPIDPNAMHRSRSMAITAQCEDDPSSVRVARPGAAGASAQAVPCKVRVTRRTRDRAARAGGDAHDLVSHSRAPLADACGTEFTATNAGQHPVAWLDPFDWAPRAVGHCDQSPSHEALIVVADHGDTAVPLGE